MEKRTPNDELNKKSNTKDDSNKNNLKTEAGKDTQAQTPEGRKDTQGHKPEGQMLEGGEDKRFTKEERSWIMYDWANSAYAAIIMAVILPIFFKSVAKDSGIAENMAVSYWGYATSIASFIIALLAPILGTIGDYKGMKMRFFKVFLLIGVTSTASLFFVNQWNLILFIYIFTFIGFAGANLFYDAFIVDVTTDERIDRVSSYGFALGYIGGSTIPLAIAIVLIMNARKIGITEGFATQISFLITAVWWICFSIPMLKNVKQINYIENEPNMIIKSFKRLYSTFMDIKKYKKIFIFLLAYFLYIDGVNTIISMAAVFGDSVGLGQNTLMMALLATQIVAFPCAILFGLLAKKFGNTTMIFAGICLYLVICVMAFKMTTATEFWIMAMLVATSMGGIQALSRSYFGKLVPKEKANEFFGFYDVFGKFAAIIGPTLFGIFSQIYGQPRYGVLSTAVLFIVGGTVFAFSTLRRPNIKTA